MKLAIHLPPPHKSFLSAVIPLRVLSLECRLPLQVGEKVRVVLDCEEHLMYFEKDELFLGVAFRHLPPVKLFISVCAVYGNTEVSMVYLGPPVDG